MVCVAAESGASYIKFQAFRTDVLVSESAQAAEYQKKNTGAIRQKEMLSKLELSLEDFEEIAGICIKEKIGFLVTPFESKIVPSLIEYGMDRIKVSSGDLTNLPLLISLAKFNLPMIVSTGMASEREVSDSVRLLKNEKVSDLTLLHCTSLYPAPPNTINLRAMSTMKDKFNVKVGFSDHSVGNHIALAAVALGACIIEKHFTLDRELPGPDHQASLEPDELIEMISKLREIEKSLGNGIKEPNESEQEVALLVRRSWHLKRDIKAGIRLTDDDIILKRPGYGLAPDQNPAGRILKQEKTADLPIYPSDLMDKS